ncbi:MAG: EamA family transporter [Bryobacteraceae bacterium]|jgi:drug/metabolite transporter (DMT)-like permease
MTTPLRSMLLMLVASFIGSFGAVFLKAGAGRVHAGLAGIRSMIFNIRLILGVGLFLLSSYFFVLGVKHGELSVLYPLVSLSYIWALLWSRLFFKEPFTKNKLAGLALILVGIAFIGMGSRVGAAPPRPASAVVQPSR